MKQIFTSILLLSAVVTAFAQKTDSVIIKVGEKSKVIFVIGDKADLQTLKQYNLQAVVDDLAAKLEQQDSSKLEKPADTYLKTEEPVKQEEPVTVERNDRWRNDDNRGEEWDRSWDERKTKRTRFYRRTYHSINFDIGTNNFITPNQQFPNSNNELYSVRPWGSWYVGINSIERTRLSRRFFLEWGAGISWYNFKFENDNIRITKDANGVTFSEDQRDVSFIKSKLTTTYLNISAVPVIDFSGRGRRPMVWNGGSGGSFRLGLGPYAGYRIDSYSKLVFKEDGDRHRERDHDNYYLNNIRYGLRLQVGFRATDLFFNYDLNELFATNKGPKLNAFSFGLTF
jgi:hypothetical protein